MNFSPVEKVEIIRVTEKKRVQLEDKVVRETPLTIFANAQKVKTLLYTPGKADCLAVGFLFTQGLISCTEEIKDVYFDPEKNFVQVKLDGSQENLQQTSSQKKPFLPVCGMHSFCLPEYVHNSTSITSSFQIKKEMLFEAMENFEKKSELFKISGGNHSAGLFDGRKIEFFAEDVGRYNAVDKVIGEYLLRKITIKDKVLFLSGRISWEILIKAFRARIPIVVSPSAPTNLAISLARTVNITLIGFLRKQRMNIYTHPWRVV